MFHVISISIFWLYQVPLYLILLYQFPDIGYIRFRYIKVCHISFHFCHIRFCYIKFQVGYIRFVISVSVISKSVISKGPSPHRRQCGVRGNSAQCVAELSSEFDPIGCYGGLKILRLVLHEPSFESLCP